MWETRISRFHRYERASKIALRMFMRLFIRMGNGVGHMYRVYLVLAMLR